jgi:starch synthase (maltosyl-transferring)
MTFSVNLSRELLTVEMPEVTLGFSADDGGLRVLRRSGGANLAGHGDPRPSVDVSLGEKGWMAERAFVRYLGYTAEERGDGVEVIVIVGIGPLMVYDRYRVTGTLIARRVSVRNVGEDEVRLRGVRLALPWLRPGAVEDSRFEAPGNSVRPRVSLAVAAEQRAGVLPRRFFAPGLRGGLAFEQAPSAAAGLMALHDARAGSTLLCWYHSAVEPALPQVDGNGHAVTLTHEVALADWMPSDLALSADTQYILLLDQPWPEALGAYQQTASLTTPPSPGLAPAAWLRDAAIYEAHPAAFGGYAGLAAALPELAACGVNTLCLLPIWDHGAEGHMWDGGWEAAHPYAVASFEHLDPALGDREELLLLVRVAHANGLRVLIDLPLAGCSPASPMLASHPEWFCRDERGGLAAPPGADVIPFDWACAGLRDYIVETALALARELDSDGFRLTLPRTAQPNWARGLPHHASASALGYLRLSEQLRAAVRAERPDAAIIGSLGGPACATRHDASVDELPHHMFFHLGLGRLTPAELADWLSDHWGALPPGAIRICFTESHTTHRLNPLADGLRGSRLSRMLLAGLVLCGFVPMLRAGQEQGEEQFLGRLLGARAASDALRYGQVCWGGVACDAPEVLTVLRRAEGGWVVGILNVGPNRRTVRLSLPPDLELPDGEHGLLDLLSGERWSEEGRRGWSRTELRHLRLTLEPFGAYALTLVPAQPAPPAAPESERPTRLLEVAGG